MKRLFVLLLSCLLFSSIVSAADFDPDKAPYKGWITNCVARVTADFPDLEEDLGEETIEAECTDWAELLDTVLKDEGLGAVLIVQLELASCTNRLKTIEGISHPILVCKNLIEKQLECTSELKAAGEKNPGGKCFWLTALAAKAVELSPELSGDGLADASLRDLVKLHMIDQCLQDAKARFPRTWDSIGEEEAVVECTDWVDFLLNTSEEYTILSWLHIQFRMQACYRYMQGLPNVTNPILRCKNLVKSVKDCVGEYEDEGKTTEEALRLCDTEAVHKAIEVKYNPELLDEMFPAQIPESVRKRIREFIDNNPVLGDFLANLDDDQRAVYMHLSRAEQKEVLEMDLEEAKAFLNRFRLRKIDPVNRFKKRVLTTAVKIRLRNAFLNRRIIYRELFQNYTAAKNDFLKAKAAENTACASDNESQECLEAVNESIKYAKEMLKILADIQIKGLELVRDKVEASEYLDEDQVEEALENIDELVDQLEDAKEMLKDAETKEEVKAAGELIRASWLTIKEKIREHHLLLKKAALRVLIQRARAFESRVEKALSRLSGAKKAQIESLLEEYSEQIEEAEDDLESGDFEIGDSEDVLGVLEEAQDVLEDISEESGEGETTIDPEGESEYEVVSVEEE